METPPIENNGTEGSLESLTQYLDELLGAVEATLARFPNLDAHVHAQKHGNLSLW